LAAVKSHQVYRVVAVALCLGIGGYVILRVQNYHEARSWSIEIKVRTPVYETSAYPYGSQSPPNAIVGYLEVGSKPDVRAMAYDKPWPYWEVRLESGKRGYIFAPDVEAGRR
jgi:hypothetical protein